MPELCVRDLKLFFKDRTAAALSLLAEFIIVGLYALFLRDQLTAGLSGLEDAGELMDVWMAAGVLGVAPFTAAMGAYGVMVEDRARGIDRDFGVSPLRRSAALGGYLSAAAAVALLTSLLLLLLAQAYLWRAYGLIPDGESTARLCALLLLIAVSDAAQVLLPVSFLRSSSALAALCTILGALIGFLTGIYIPVGGLPERVRGLVACFPASHGAMLLRREMVEPLLSRSFGGTDTASALQFEEYMGIRCTWDGALLPEKTSVWVLLAAGGVCLGLAVMKELLPRRR